MLLEGEAAQRAYLCFTHVGATGGVNKAADYARHALPFFQLYHSLPQDRLHNKIPKTTLAQVSMVETVFGNDLQLYLQAMYHLRFWKTRETPYCLYQTFLMYYRFNS